jgi:nucleoside-diphosphate-sugar epimerase
MSVAGEPGVAGRTVLVTGADGFIGSHLTEALLAAGARVRAFCLYNSFGSAGWLEESDAFQRALVDGQAELVLGDIRDAELVDAAVAGVDVVLHLAALIAIPYSYVAPRSYVDTNIT